MKESKNTQNDNVKVVVRVRPPLIREIEGEIFMSTVQVFPDHKKIQLFEYFNLDNVAFADLETYINNPYNYAKHQYTFDDVYDENSSQQEIYDNTAKLSVCSALEGYNATILAYGQTGTGKTYTMEGFKYDMVDQERGIIPRAVEDIFRYIENCEDQTTTFMVRASYIQIYNQQISDLLRYDRKNLQIREDPRKGVFVEGVSEWAVVKPHEIIDLMKMGVKSRATAKTNMNESSSRSHAVFIIVLQQIKETVMGNEGKECKVAKLNLVDLAGSQRVRVTGASGKRLQECKKINVSLSCLGMVIAALTEAKPHSHIPYRNSALTRLLSDSLGGNCKTTMLTMISPATQAFHESLSSLKFAHRAKSIRNKPAINEDLDQKALIRKYENELSKLRNELEERNKILIDKSKLVQLEEEKCKIQQDKNQVIMALQQRSNDFFREREQKKLLEEKIKAFNSQLIHGGNQHLEKAFTEQKMIIKEYERKIKSLESEKILNQSHEHNEDLFKKQNLILMNLAAKLNERDQVNMHLNEEICAYDRIIKETQDNLQRKACRIEQLEAELIKHRIAVPKEVYKVQKVQEKMDGVYIEGEMTYNITQNNLRRASQQISTLKQVNGKQKIQITRLREQLQRKDSIHNESEMGYNKSTQQNINGYRNIKQSIDIITKGLRRKENSDMKVIIEELFNIQKVVNQHLEQ